MIVSEINIDVLCVFTFIYVIGKVLSQIGGKITEASFKT
jgi:hypothetical protein